MSGRPKRTRAGSNIVAPIDSQASDPDYMKKMMEAMIKVAAQNAGITTNGKSPSVTLVEFQQFLAQQDEAIGTQPADGDEDGEEEAEKEAEEEEEEEKEGGRCGAMSSTSRTMDSTLAGNAIMTKLQEIQQHQGSMSKHSFGYADNPGQVCGVCSAQWEPDCHWSKGKGNWGCFTCQVYICSFECLNKHNQEGIGNTVKAGCRIYPKGEYVKRTS